MLELRPGSGAPLKTTPASAATINAERQTVKLSLDSRGDGSGTVRLDTRGASALDVKQRLLAGAGKLSDWLRKQLWMHSTHVASARRVPAGDFADIASVEGGLGVPHVLLRAPQGDALFRVSDVFASWARPMGRQRKTDVVSFFAETRESLLTLELPAGTQVLSLPKDEDFESDDADLPTALEEDGDRARGETQAHRETTGDSRGAGRGRERVFTPGARGRTRHRRPALPGERGLAMRTLALVIVTALASGCATGRTIEFLSPAKLQFDATQYPDDPALVLFRRITPSYASATDPWTEYERHEAIAVLTEAAFELAEVRVPVWPKAELQHFYARVVQPDGTEQTWDGTKAARPVGRNGRARHQRSLLPLPRRSRGKCPRVQLERAWRRDCVRG